MRKFKIPVGCFTFLIGIGLATVWQFYVKPVPNFDALEKQISVFENLAEQTSVCQMLDHPY